MFSGYYIAASGVLTRQRELDVIGNNMVNMQTPGYHSEKVVISAFQQELMTRKEGYDNEAIHYGVGDTAVRVDAVLPADNAGLIKGTGRELDFAISGEGYFNVEAADGTLYMTRNGQFSLNNEGELILPGVGTVMGSKGAIELDGESFRVDADGIFYNEEGKEIAEFLLTTLPEEGAAVKYANGMYAIEAGVDAEPLEQYHMMQGYIEQSNVDMNHEMTTMMEAQRAFQLNSSALQIIDALNRKSIQIAAV